MLREYVGGKEAAAIAGMDRADSVWRAVARHGAAYPRRIEVIELGRAKVARRDELAAFAAWYQANVHRDTRPNAARAVPVSPPEPVEKDEAAEKRRRALRAAIRFIQEEKNDD